MSLLIIGGTGTLGRQIVLQALTKGYRVRCTFRNYRKAKFLKDWGAELVYADLTKPETIPRCLKGITAIIDASTGRPSELNSVQKVDWEGKIFLLEAAEAAKIKSFIFFTIQDCQCPEFNHLSLMLAKRRMEERIVDSKISFTIISIQGFYQGLIDQYAIPILENVPIWVNDDNEIPFSYIDTQDVANFCLRSLQLPIFKKFGITLKGIKSWTPLEIINLCEQLVGQPATIKWVPFYVLPFVSSFFGFFKWGENISDRLAFSEISKLNIESVSSEQLLYTYELFKIDPLEILSLDDYFLEFFIRLLKRLRDINFEDVQKQKNLII